jgi:hypothetical protein
VVTVRQRLASLAVTALVGTVGTLFGPVAPALASPAAAQPAAAQAAVAGPVAPAISGVVAPGRAPNDQCTTDQWRNPANFDRCVGKLQDLASGRVQCLAAPTPSAPDSGMAGWFASRPDSSRLPGPQGYYSDYGYAGYDYTTYDIGCVPTVMHPDFKFENTVANGEFLTATAVVGASNALRERAWSPKSMWGWADPLVDKATRAVYQKVFTVFGTITLMVIGLYLLWRSRQSDMSAAMTTAGWAILIMVVVTAIARWPAWSANVADSTLVTTLGVVHEAVGPPSQDTPPDKCVLSPDACKDHRAPAVRASDTATEGLLYRNWLRGALGSADSPVAQRYGPVLYDAKSFSWDEIEEIRKDPSQRQHIIDTKARHWMKVAEQIKTEDPEAYTYLQGTRGMDRIGAGFIAILSALFFAMFDITASVLVLLGFLIFRWAVIAAPILGTVGLLRPASSGIRRLGNAVVAAVFNVVIFGTGSAVYLFAVNLIMGTASLPGWLQVVLIWLTGVVGWLLLRPYRRITQLGGKDSSTAVTSIGSWHRRFLRDARQTAALQVVDEGGTAEPALTRRREVLLTQSQRPETRLDSGTDSGAAAGRSQPAATAPRQRRDTPQWTEPDVPEEAPSYAIYRPGSSDVETPARGTRRPESSVVRG